MAGDKDARVVVGIDGADDVARPADRATAPWRRAGEAVAGGFRRAGQAISSQRGPLGIVMHNSLGVTDEMDKALGKIRAQAEALGTVGGAAAFQDQILALGGALTGVATQSEEARSRVTALIGILGKGYSAPQAQQIQQ